MKISPIVGYECKKCSTVIPANTGGVYRKCKCMSIGVDGNGIITRLHGNKKLFLPYRTGNIEIVYRIKEISSGLFFRPRKGCDPSKFTKDGKFYSKKPNLKWVPDGTGECVIEIYKIEKILN